MTRSRRREFPRPHDTVLSFPMGDSTGSRDSGHRRGLLRSVLDLAKSRWTLVLCLALISAYWVYRISSSPKAVDLDPDDLDRDDQDRDDLARELDVGAQEVVEDPVEVPDAAARPRGPDLDGKGLVYMKVDYKTIPHIVHQMWNTYDVPREFSAWIRSWTEMNPGWEYWFWTPDDVTALLKQHYFSGFLKTWNDYPYDVMRSEAARYYILEIMGGLYADVDLECLRPCDPWVDSHQCILSEEPEVHSRLVSAKGRPTVINAVMGSRPGHPFFHMTVQALPDLIQSYPDASIAATGTEFLDAMLGSYRNFSADFRKRPENGISVLAPEHFMSTFDPVVEEIVRKQCLVPEQLDETTRRLCNKLEEEGYGNEVSRMAFADHHWSHSFEKPQEFNAKETVSIFDLVKNVKTFSGAYK